ncbi:ATP-binding cassette domain-containing protein [Pendulispora brunnea]|uniref:ATP-binding cassette domain-containing protein n=2 Tax=Pendulispora brunnea TaxID=2905690 RepID=A0ABZ2KP81_9BACT
MIEVDGVEKTYGRATALAPTSIRFEAGTTTSIIGPSGCGKSTLLRIIAGLIPADRGKVTYDGEVLSPDNVNALRLRTGFVLQDGGLFPHLTAQRNVTLVAEVMGRGTDASRRERVKELAALVRLPEARLVNHPRDLSGGERQRVSMMRALFLDPSWVLLDEPLGALDPITRRGLQTELRSIFARLNKTVILVTHDMGEAAYLGDRVLLMRAGRVVQEGTARELAEQPAEPFVSEFLRAQRSPLEEDAA